MLPHRTDIEVFLSIVEHIFRQKRVVSSRPFHLGMEHIVLHIRCHSAIKHIFVVLFATITGVGYNLRALSTVSVVERLQIINEGSCICGTPIDTVVGNELVLGGYLYVVSRLGLSIVHRILFHTHKCSIGVGLAVAVTLA